MKAAVLGMGKVGHGTAALLASRGLEVSCFTRDAEKAEAINRHGITVSGALNGNFRAEAFTDIGQAVRDARLLVVATTARGHRPMAELLRGRLQQGQRIVVLVGNWGAYECYSVLGEEAREKGVIIGETSGNLAACPTLTHPATVFMKPIKRSMPFAAIPGSAGPAVAEELRQAFPEFSPVASVLDTSLNSTNPPIHVPFCIFNITRMANGEDSLLYGECLPPMLLDFTMAADRERCAVAKAAGVEPRTILELLNDAWHTSYDNLKTLGLENDSLRSVKLPKSPYHRFLTEDVPFGYMAVSRLGKMYHVPTPRIDLLVDAYRYLLADQAELDGPVFDLDLSEVL